MRQLGLELTFCYLKSDTWPWCNCVSLLHLRFLVSIKLTNEIKLFAEIRAANVLPQILKAFFIDWFDALFQFQRNHFSLE